MGEVCFYKQKMGCDRVFMLEQLFIKIVNLFIQISSLVQLGVLPRVGQKSGTDLENKFVGPQSSTLYLGDLPSCSVLGFPMVLLPHEVRSGGR